MGVAPPPPEEPRPAPAAPELAGACPRCSTPFEPLQEYCLECGLRLPLTSGMVPRLHAAWTRRLPWYPGDWIWPVLLALLIAALGALVAVSYADDEGATDRRVGGTEPIPTLPAATDTAPAPPTTTAPVAVPTTTAQATTVPEQPPAGALRQWPADRNGYTIVLASLPSSGGRAAATQKAKQAASGGLTDVGVIDSGDFSSLHPGYYVVFSGIYTSLTEAEAAIPGVQSAGFPQAYPRQITR